MDKWKIVLVVGEFHKTFDFGYIYMDWEYPPFTGQMLRMAGHYMLYLVREAQNEKTDGKSDWRVQQGQSTG